MRRRLKYRIIDGLLWIAQGLCEHTRADEELGNRPAEGESRLRCLYCGRYGERHMQGFDYQTLFVKGKDGIVRRSE